MITICHSGSCENDSPSINAGILQQRRYEDEAGSEALLASSEALSTVSEALLAGFEATELT